MKIINKGRGNGKTWDLIKEASNDINSRVLFSNEVRMSNFQIKANEMYKNGEIKRLPYVMHITELNRIRKEFRNQYNYYVDELDYFIKDVVGAKIKTATMTGIIEDYNRDSENVNSTLKEEILNSRDKAEYKFILRDGTSGVVQLYTGDINDEGYLMYTKKVNGDKTVYKDGRMDSFTRSTQVEVMDYIKLCEYDDDLKHKGKSKLDIIKIWARSDE